MSWPNCGLRQGTPKNGWIQSMASWGYRKTKNWHQDNCRAPLTAPTICLAIYNLLPIAKVHFDLCPRQQVLGSPVFTWASACPGIHVREGSTVRERGQQLQKGRTEWMEFIAGGELTSIREGGGKNGVESLA